MKKILSILAVGPLTLLIWFGMSRAISFAESLVPYGDLMPDHGHLGGGSLTIVKWASPRDGSDFTFELSDPTDPPTPTYLSEWGSLGTGDGQFYEPWDLALDTAGNVYVTDPSPNNRIQATIDPLDGQFGYASLGSINIKDKTEMIS